MTRVNTRLRVKVCCIASLDEAQLAIAHGADALGLVSSMPSGPGVISETTIADIVQHIPPPIGTFLLTSATSSTAIVEQQRRCGTNTLQLCDQVERSVYRDLHRELPGIALVQVVHVTGPESIDHARESAEHVQALLLDSGNPASPIKELGGTGRTHDWTTSRRIRDSVHIPLFLAGGLNPGNVAAAVAAVDPFGVDLCTGVRTNDRLDPEKLGAFFKALP